DLTRLFNRRFLDKALNRIVSESSIRCNTILVVLDIDNFKKINDEHGHIIGDSVLQLLSTTLRSSLWPLDSIARFGGDEFCIIMERTPGSQAVNIIERLRQNFKQNSEKILGKPLRLSIGIAPWREEFNNSTQWLAHADALLYKAKRNGRDRLET
ncbi:GGDEF domain-containing protein, partial [Corynebacterium pseudodiphtheriticum]